MIVTRPAAERGHFDHGWLDTSHTFSFADYHDPAHMGFRTLRVMNEDRVRGGRGFGAHSHSDMEIVTYVLEGALEHADSMGNGSVIGPGEVQRMSAGTGVTHSEVNPQAGPSRCTSSRSGSCPSAAGSRPATSRRRSRRGGARALRLVASPDGRDGAVTIHQDVDLYARASSRASGCSTSWPRGRHAWLQW